MATLVSETPQPPVSDVAPLLTVIPVLAYERLTLARVPLPLLPEPSALKLRPLQAPAVVLGLASKVTLFADDVFTVCSTPPLTLRPPPAECTWTWPLLPSIVIVTPAGMVAPEAQILKGLPVWSQVAVARVPQIAVGPAALPVMTG